MKPPSIAERTRNTWSPKELGRYLEIAHADRLYGLWVLVASTGMRRSELCGLQLPALDLNNRTVQMTTTRVMAGEKATKGSGKGALAVVDCWRWTGSRPRCCEST
ncbi:hypothetical protein CFP66_23305 [Pseudonocardia sp. MH-G8]|nr:hypothetical protein CFP66_23305 [Pseudonocardia sp. MH-G8]